METKIKVTHSGSYSANFEHDDVIYRIDWEDDSDIVYLFQKWDDTIQSLKVVSIPAEIVPTLISIFNKIEESKK
jgi:hypothetical protein